MARSSSNMTCTNLLKEARAEHIPEGKSRLWSVRKHTLNRPFVTERARGGVVFPQGTYTSLHCFTESTLLQRGELIMNDTPHELNTHLQFMLRAYGKVLVTGLGLGCVIRGLLANPKVEHITCIERSKDVLKLVQPHMPKDRLTIIKADAMEYVNNGMPDFDCAWHDLWTDREKGEPHLTVLHNRLIIECAKKVKHQGAWKLDRWLKKAYRNHGESII